MTSPLMPASSACCISCSDMQQHLTIADSERRNDTLGAISA